MKFATSPVYGIFVSDRPRTIAHALAYIYMMYVQEYGDRAGSLHESHLTPNEERLAQCLVERSKDVFFAPIVVECGKNDYLFYSHPDIDGHVVPPSDRVKTPHWW